MSESRILFVAYEPWETELGDGFLRKLKNKFPSMELALVIADPYQVQNEKNLRYLRNVAYSGDYRTYVIFEDMRNWQRTIRNSSEPVSFDRLNCLAIREGVDGIGSILKSEIHFYPRERCPLYTPMTDSQISTAARLVMEQCLSAINDFEPSLIVSVGEQYLVKNIIASLAQARGIELRIIRHARFKDFLKCDPFFMPDLKVKPGAPLKLPSKVSSDPAPLRDLNGVLYDDNLASSWAGFTHKARNQPVLSTIESVAASVRKVVRLAFVLIYKRSLPFYGLRYFVPMYFRTLVYYSAKLLRQLRFIWMPRGFVGMDSLPEKFFLVPLHYRPESSTLTLGEGLEDEDVILRVSDELRSIDEPVVCVVLEHPAMIEDRKIGWYRRNSKRNIVFADPVISTQQLIRGSIGVITVSGTAALEASLAGIPAHVMGRPEFAPSINSRGPERLAEFILGCVEGSELSSKDSVTEYFAEIQETGWRGNLGWSIVKSPQQLSRAVELVTEMVVESSPHLHNS